MDDAEHEAFKDEIERWLGFVASYDWPASAQPYIDGASLMVPEVYVRDGREVVEWARVRTRDQLLRVLGMGPAFD